MRFAGLVLVKKGRILPLKTRRLALGTFVAYLFLSVFQAFCLFHVEEGIGNGYGGHHHGGRGEARDICRWVQRSASFHTLPAAYDFQSIQSVFSEDPPLYPFIVQATFECPFTRAPPLNLL